MDRDYSYDFIVTHIIPYKLCLFSITEIPCDKKFTSTSWGLLNLRGSRGVFRQDVLSGMDLICSLFHRDVDRRRDDRGPFPCTLASRHIIVASSHPWDPPKPLVALLVARLSEASVWFVAGDVAGGWAQVEGLTEASFAQQYTRSVEWAVSRSCQFMEF